MSWWKYIQAENSTHLEITHSKLQQDSLSKALQVSLGCGQGLMMLHWVFYLFLDIILIFASYKLNISEHC